MTDLETLRAARVATEEGLISAQDYDVVKMAFLRAQQIKAGFDAGFIREEDYVRARDAYLNALDFSVMAARPSSGGPAAARAPSPALRAGAFEAPSPTPQPFVPPGPAVPSPRPSFAAAAAAFAGGGPPPVAAPRGGGGGLHSPPPGRGGAASPSAAAPLLRVRTPTASGVTNGFAGVPASAAGGGAGGASELAAVAGKLRPTGAPGGAGPGPRGGGGGGGPAAANGGSAPAFVMPPGVPQYSRGNTAGKVSMAGIGITDDCVNLFMHMKTRSAVGWGWRGGGGGAGGRWRAAGMQRGAGSWSSGGSRRPPPGGAQASRPPAPTPSAVPHPPPTPAPPQFKWITFKINDSGKLVVPDAAGGKGSTYPEFIATLPPNQCRYGGGS
jgi:hypothetical protein